MKRVAFTVTYPPDLVHPMHRGVMEAEAVGRAELLAWGPTPDVTTLLWFDGPGTAVRSVLSGVESVTTASLVAEDGGTYAFLRQDAYEFADAVMDLVSRSRVIFLPPVTFLDAGSVEFEAAGDPEDLAAFHDALTDLATATIRRVDEFQRRASPATVTDRQREALAAAVEVGYYEVPRSGTVADVAAELDCATSTAGELLRKAEAAVVTEHLERS